MISNLQDGIRWLGAEGLMMVDVDRSQRMVPQGPGSQPPGPCAQLDRKVVLPPWNLVCGLQGRVSWVPSDRDLIPTGCDSKPGCPPKTAG